MTGLGGHQRLVLSPLFRTGLTAAMIAWGSAPLLAQAALSTSPSWVVSGDQESASLGYSVAPAGDVNGDGFDDVIVGEPFHYNNPPGTGLALLYLGSSTGLSTTPAWTASVFYQFADFGWSVASAGDVNGDGYADVIVGAPQFTFDQAREGAAFLYLGSPQGLSGEPSARVEGDQQDSFFGNAVASAGDVNGDGYDDVIVGADNYANAGGGRGSAFLYLGSASGLSSRRAWSFGNDSPFAGLGYSVATAGDVNGDGFDDILVGHPDFTRTMPHQGRAFLFPGSPTGPSSTPAWSVEGSLSETFVGISFAGAVDVNRDGLDDVLVGEIRDDQTGPHLYLGSFGGLSSQAAWVARVDRPGGQFGWSVASAGDVNGDGFGDVVIGARLYSDEGRAFVFLGSSSGPADTPAWTGSNGRSFSHFGEAVAGAGDVDGDGADDVIVGAPYDDQIEPGIFRVDVGTAYVFLGIREPPTLRADAGPDRSVECASPSGTDILLDGSASTAPDSTPGTNDGIILFEWFESFGAPSQSFLGAGETIHATLALGLHPITLRVTDRSGATATDEAAIAVADTTPPVISVGLAPATLWPPNHRLVEVRADLRVVDACGSATAVLVSLTSNEPDDAPGGADGHTVNDVQGDSPGTADVEFRLRAERDATGPGRVYSALYRATDASGNASSAVATAAAPHDLHGVIEPLMIEVGQSANGTVLNWPVIDGAVHYSVIRGRVAALKETSDAIDLGAVTCVEARSVDASTVGNEDAEDPERGAAFFYLVEYDDGAVSSYGTEDAGKPREPSTGGCV